MTGSISTLLGEHAVILLPGHGDDDPWWACLDRVPQSLLAEGPRVATGYTPQQAAEALAHAIDRYLRPRMAADG